MEADTDVCVPVRSWCFFVDFWYSLYAHMQASVYVECLHMCAPDITATPAFENPTGRVGVYVYLHHMKPQRHAEGFVRS